jgi:hypothetical protein
VWRTDTLFHACCTIGIVAIERTHKRVVTRNFGPVRFWRDGLNEIVDVIQQVHPVKNLEVDGYRCDRVDDLADLEELRINRFALKSDDEAVTLILDRDTAQISAVEPDLATRGMLSEVERISMRHERVPARQMLLGLLPLAALLGVVLGLDAFEIFPQGWFGALLGVLTAVVVMLGLPYLTRRWFRPRCMAILYTRTSTEAPTWLQRNRDALITNAIVSAVFLVIGILIGQAS